MDSELGALKSGYLADLLILDADPLADIRNTQKIDMAQLRGTADWKRYTVTLEKGKAVRAVVQLVMFMGGDVWFDDVVLTVSK